MQQGQEGVVDLHDTGNDLSCYQCQSGFNLDGTSLLGANVNCHVPDVSETIPRSIVRDIWMLLVSLLLHGDSFILKKEISRSGTVLFLRTSSFWKKNWKHFYHQTISGLLWFQNGIREETCSINQIDEGSVTTCKSTCSSNCNNNSQKRRQCYVWRHCRLRWKFGVGQQSCFITHPLHMICSIVRTIRMFASPKWRPTGTCGELKQSRSGILALR